MGVLSDDLVTFFEKLPCPQPRTIPSSEREQCWYESSRLKTFGVSPINELQQSLMNRISHVNPVCSVSVDNLGLSKERTSRLEFYRISMNAWAAHLLLAPLKSSPPTMPAVIATPLMIATPMSPSFATLSSIKPLKLVACMLAGS